MPAQQSESPGRAMAWSVQNRVTARQRSATSVAPGRRWGGRPRATLGGPLLLLAFLVTLMALLEGDLPDVLGGVGQQLATTLPRLGQFAPFGLLFLEESGVLVVVPGDVLIIYVARGLPHAPVAWGIAWISLVGCSVLGSSVLYGVARRWGRALATGWLGTVLHLTPARLARAEQWFGRWGSWTIIFGRHIFGLRIPVTVAAGIFKVRYPVFAASVATSAVIWVGVFLLLGATLGGPIEVFLRLHRRLTLSLPVLAFTVLCGYVALRLVRARQGEKAA